MLSSYVRIAFRRMARNPGITAANVCGLALAMACALVIAISIRYELSFDEHHEHFDRIYELVWSDLWASMGRLDPETLTELADVTAAVGFQSYRPLLSYEDRHFYQPMTFAHPTVFDVFTIRMVQGDPASVLGEPYSMVLSESTAQKFFGDGDVVGQVLMWDGTYPYTVRGVMADSPDNAELGFEVLASMATIDGPQFGNRPYHYTWIVAPSGYRYDEEAFGERALEFYRRHESEQIVPGQMPRLVPLERRHQSPALMDRLFILATVGAFVLLVACVNYTNLSTARAVMRSRETGVRRVTGASRTELVRQYLIEAAVLVLVAWVISVGLVWVTLPASSAFLDRDLSAVTGLEPSLVLLALAVGIIPAILGGTYPALVLSGFQPALGLRSTPTTGSAGRARKLLVVVQFGVAAFLIVVSLVVHDQLTFMNERDVGYEPRSVVMIPLQNRAVWERWPVFRQRLQEDPRLEITATFTAPMTWLPEGTYRRDGQAQPKAVSLLGGGAGMVEVYRMRLIAGQGFPTESDTAGVCVLNESAVADLGFSSPAEALGQRIEWHNDFLTYDKNSHDYEGTVVGVVEDLHWESLHRPVKPTILFPCRGWEGHFTLRLDPTNADGALDFVRHTWEAVIPELPLNLLFLESRFAALYRSEQRLGHIITAFTGVAIVLTAVGLFSLSSLLTQQRTRAVAIRKAVGASVVSLLRLMTRELTWLVVIGNAIAWPISHYAAHWWLAGFAYRVDAPQLVFLVTAVATVASAWLTVGYQTLRVVLAGPADALRHE